MPSDPEPIPSRTAAAIAGIAAGAAALGVAELLAGLLPGAASPIIAVGDLVIALQPPGAKQFVVDLVGEADKLVLNLFIAAVAVAITAGIGVLARTRPGTARILIALGGILALGAGLRDPLAEPITTLIVAAAAVGVAIWMLGWLMRLAAEGASRPVAEMPDWRRRRFLGTSIAVVGVAAASGFVGRTLLDRGRLNAVAQGGAIPAPVETASPLPAGASLDVRGPEPDRRPEPRLLPDRYRAPRPAARHRHLAVAPERHGRRGRSSSPTTSCSRWTSTSST